MRGDVFLKACNRQDIKAHAILFQYFAKGARFRFPADQKFFDPRGSAAVLDTFGLGARQYMVYGHRIAGGVATPKWFHSGVDFSFVARPTRRDVERYFLPSVRDPPPGIVLVARAISVFRWRATLKRRLPVRGIVCRGLSPSPCQEWISIDGQWGHPNQLVW